MSTYQPPAVAGLVAAGTLIVAFNCSSSARAADNLASPTPPPNPAVIAPATPTEAAAAQSVIPQSAELTEVVIHSTEPRFVMPTRRDRIGRIWAPVYITGQGPFRLVVDSGAN